MVMKVQLLPAGVELLRLQASMVIHRAEPVYLQEKIWRFPFRAACKLAQVIGWDEEEEHRLNLYEEARWSLEAATILFITSMLAHRVSEEGEELGLGDVTNALSQFPLIAAGMSILGAPATVVPSLMWPTVVLEQETPGTSTSEGNSGPWARSPGPSDQQETPAEDNISTTTSRDTSTVSLSDEEYDGLEGQEDPLLGVKQEVTEHAQLQAMFGQPPVVHRPNPYYVDSSSEGEMEQGEMEKEQGQVVMMTEEGITVVTLSSDEEGGE